MSSPGNWGSGGYGQYDPNAGPPGPSNQQYQGFGAFQQPQQPPQQPLHQPQQQVYPGMVGGYPTPPRKSRGPLIAAVALASVAVIAIITTVVVLSTGNEAAPPLPQPSSRMTPSRTTSAPPETSQPADPNLTPVVPGWQVASVPRRAAVYDVPPGWELDPNPDNIHAVGPPDDSVTMTGVADYQKGFCPGDLNSFRATSGASARKGPDDTTVANETLQKFATLGYTRDGHAPQIAASPPEQVTLGDGSTRGVRVNALITLTAPGNCDAQTVAISVVATNSDGQSSVVFIAASDQNVPDAVTPDTLNQMSQSLRGAPA